MTGRPLGRVVVLTDRLQAEAAGHRLVDLAAAVAGAGADTLVFREKDLPEDPRRRLAADVAGAIDPTATRLVIASDVALARDLGAVGVHLAASDPSLVADDIVVGRSCHDEAEVDRAVEERADLVTVSPIRLTASKPGHGPALGPTRGASLVGGRLPGYALGGIEAAQVEECLAAGFAGVAIMGAVNRAGDPARVVRDVVDRARATVGAP
ncbi:MAG: thiamine phosphate synthase [Actinomycetota bacterium]